MEVDPLDQSEIMHSASSLHSNLCNANLLLRSFTKMSGEGKVCLVSSNGYLKIFSNLFHNVSYCINYRNKKLRTYFRNMLVFWN